MKDVFQEEVLAVGRGASRRVLIFLAESSESVNVLQGLSSVSVELSKSQFIGTRVSAVNNTNCIIVLDRYHSLLSFNHIGVVSRHNATEQNEEKRSCSIRCI